MAKKAREPKKFKSGRYVVREDHEERPEVIRYFYSGRSKLVAGAGGSGSDPPKDFAYKVLGQIRKNILTQMNGRWTPIQWGPRKGSPALLKGVDEWTVTKVDSRTYRVQPKRQHRKKWRGHIGGLLITPKRKKALHFIGYGDVELLRPWVKLPKRDPRPTESQLRRL